MKLRSATPQRSLPTDVRKVVEYWRASLLDSQRIEVSVEQMSGFGVELPFSEIVQGGCRPEIYKSLSEKQDSKRTQGRRFAEPNQKRSALNSSELAVIISPLRFALESRSRSGGRRLPPFIEPFWIPAIISSNGELLPSKQALPWIPRALLETVTSDSAVTIGSLESYEEFLETNVVPESSWTEYLRFCERLFRVTCGVSLGEIDVTGYVRRQHGLIVIDNSSAGSIVHAMSIYDDLLAGFRPPGVLKNLISLTPVKHRYVSQSVNSFFKGALRHVGQFEYKFALSPSQRNAVHRFFECNVGDILTVTGPPGTGKTTFLQSIIASLWVERAIRNLEPPVILACAGTNQAVTNIIASFKKASTKPGPLSGRWLPGVESYGTYCVATSRAQEVKGVHLEMVTGEGLSRAMAGSEYIRNAEIKYLEHFAEYSGKRRNLNKAVRLLQAELKKEVWALRRELSAARFGSFFEHILDTLLLRKKINLQHLRTAVEPLDCSRRHRAFQLATHYWEGRWLLSAKAREQGPSQGRFNALPPDWRQRAMVTPCFVSTVNMAPRFFGKLTREGATFVDLLIVDEAGQVSPEVGAACFALANTALVVGDTEQLEPVWSVPKHIDIQNLKLSKLIKNADDRGMIATLKKLGITASSGNLMQLAQKACRIVENNTIGVFLAEHRRSVPEIVQYCNALSYQGRLVPMRPALRKRILPALGYLSVSGSERRVGTSLENVDEAKAIFHWLQVNDKRLREFYQAERLEELVAVITPFAAQRALLERLLGRDYPSMTIGTVHALQGAERRIVIFSPVYSEPVAGTFFFDRGSNMLNVAVSRAQDSFLVFGKMSLLNVDQDTPSGLLGKFLLQRPENEVPAQI